MEQQKFLVDKHKRLIRNCINIVPADYVPFQTSRATLLYFLLSGLDLLGNLEDTLNEQTRQRIIDWIYSLQLGHSAECLSHQFGFRGTIVNSNNGALNKTFCPYDSAHLAQTYSALCSLLIIGDDFHRLDRDAILEGVRCCQCKDGSFSGTGDKTSENDMRFVFCAAAICYILDDFSKIDLNSMLSFIQRSVSFDGGIGQGPGLESHGGSTFCAIASLALTGRLWDESVLSSAQIERLKCWALMKQEEGFHGRINKLDDSCYSFWLGATLTLLNAQSLINWTALRSFLMRMQDNMIGGFCKCDESSHSDFLHTYFSLAALGMFGEPLVRPIFPALNISMRAHEHLMEIKRRRACND